MCAAVGDPAPTASSVLPDQPPSPLLSRDDPPALDELPPSYRHPDAYVHEEEEEEEEEEGEAEGEEEEDEDLQVPPDFELRGSGVPGAGLGVWSVVRLENGERFGPYMGKHMPRAGNRSHGCRVRRTTVGEMRCNNVSTCSS